MKDALLSSTVKEMKNIKKILLQVITLALLAACNNNNTNSNSELGIDTPNSTTRVSPNGNRALPDPGADCVPNSEHILGTVLRGQEEYFWCWAASGEMVMEHLGNTITQCKEANELFGRRDCCNSTIPVECDEGGWPEFEKYGFSADTTHNTALQWEDIKNQISCRKTPFCVTWRWTDSQGRPTGGGHMMVISAYKTEDGEDWVKILDPLPVDTGSARWIRYSEYVGAPDYNHWDDFYNIKRK